MNSIMGMSGQTGNIMMQAFGAMMRGESPRQFLQGLAQSNPALQGLDFNNLQQTAQSIADLGYRMDKCCCEIKTQMLQDRLQDTQFALQNANDIANNANQSMYLISQLKTTAAA